MSDPIPLEPGKYYHIYNRGNNRENIFNERRNYAHFCTVHYQVEHSRRRANSLGERRASSTP